MIKGIILAIIGVITSPLWSIIIFIESLSNNPEMIKKIEYAKKFK